MALLIFNCGTAVVIILTYLTSILNLPQFNSLILYTFVAVVIYALIKSILKYKSQLITRETAIAVIGIFFFSLLNIRSGSFINNQLHFFGVNAQDGFTHLAYSKNLEHTFPPTNPSFAGLPLQGYHFFFPLLISQIHIATQIPYLDILYRIMPIFIGIVYASGIALFARACTKNVNVYPWVMLFAFAGSHFAGLLPNGQLLYTGWEDPIGLVHNPSALFSIGLLGTGVFTLFQSRYSFKYIFLTAIILAVLPMLKVYSAVIFCGGIVAYYVANIYQKQFTYLAKITIPLAIGALCAAWTYLPYNANSVSLVFFPFEYFAHFMAQKYIAAGWHWAVEKIIFEEDQNYLRIAILYMQAIVVFFALNLGNRLIMLGLLAKFKLVKQYLIQILTIGGLISTAWVIPTLFIQSISVFDIGQFFWLSSSILSIPAGAAAYLIAEKLKSKKLSIILILLILTPALFQYKAKANIHILSSSGSMVFTQEDLAVFNVTTQTVKPSEFVIVMPMRNPTSEFSHNPMPIITGMTGRSAYYEKSTTQFALNEIESQRKAKVEELATAVQSCDLKAKEFVSEIGTTYIVSSVKIHCPQIVNEISSSNQFHFYNLK